MFNKIKEEEILRKTSKIFARAGMGAMFAGLLFKDVVDANTSQMGRGIPFPWLFYTEGDFSNTINLSIINFLKSYASTCLIVLTLYGIYTVIRVLKEERNDQ